MLNENKQVSDDDQMRTRTKRIVIFLLLTPLWSSFMFFVMLKLIPADADVQKADIEQRTLGLHSTSQMCSSVNGNRFLCPRFVTFNQQLNDDFIRLNDNFKQVYCCGLDKCCDDIILSIEPVLTENVTTKSIGVIIGTIYLILECGDSYTPFS